MMPNFLIIGAMKSGTTALYYYLEQHPEDYMSPVKEPNYYLPSQGQENAVGAVTHIGTYQDLFRDVSGEQLSVKRPIPTFTNPGPSLRSDATSLRPNSSLFF